MKFPQTRKEDFSETLHGAEVADPYRWLEGDPEEPELHAWLVEEAEAASAYFAAQPLRNTLRDEFKKLAAYESYSIPIPKQGRYFYLHRLPDQDLAALCVREGLAGVERVLLDPNTLSPDKTTVLTSWRASKDGKWLAYGLSKSGNDKQDLHVLSVDTGETLSEVISGDLYPSISSWNTESTGFWYLRRAPDAAKDELKFHKRTYFHSVGTDTAEDAYIWGNGFGREWYPHVSTSDDGKYELGIAEGQEDSMNCGEVYVRKAGEKAEFTLVYTRVPGTELNARIHKDRIYILTNNDAPRWRLLSIGIEEALSGTRTFTEVLAEQEDVLESFICIGERLFGLYIKNVQSVISEYSLAGTFVRKLDLPGVGTVSRIYGEPDGKELFYTFNSFAYPPAIFRVNLETNKQECFHQVAATFDTRALTTEQVWCTSKDGTKIPYFLVRRADLKKDGQNPTLLYGYGGFDVSLRPGYTTDPIPFIERGGIYVVANLRGGGEFGREWHEAGMKHHKQNVFDDFIAVAESLISHKYTSQKKLGIMGGSNGGLLVAATELQRPDLMAAVVCRVPVADMLRFHLHHGGSHWIPDFGDPADAEMFEHLLRYSPYHNVQNGTEYPATLVMTSDGDDRVHPLHAYKFAARLQEANISDKPILMRVEMQAGHSGAQSVARAAEQNADMWSFLFDQLGVCFDDPGVSSAHVDT